MKKLAWLAAVSLTVNSYAAEAWWPQFRGPNCSGVSETARPPLAFAPGTNQLWKSSVSPGASSPVVWRDRIFLTAFDGGRLEVQAYSRKDGHQLWKREVPVTRLEEYNLAEGS